MSLIRNRRQWPTRSAALVPAAKVLKGPGPKNETGRKVAVVRNRYLGN